MSQGWMSQGDASFGTFLLSTGLCFVSITKRRTHWNAVYEWTENEKAEPVLRFSFLY